MKLLITGGAGFIGSNFIRWALDEHTDWEITNIDKLTYAGNLENLKGIESNPRYSFVKGDIADREAINEIMNRGYDSVINFAAESHVDRSILDSSPFIDTNIKGTQVLLDSARQHNIRKYLQVSTDEVYGSLGPEGSFTETSLISPSSPYSASKAAADHLCFAYHRTYGLPVVVTRCSNNFGPYQFPEKFVPLIITNALENKPVPLYGDGLNVRDWIYVQDHCRALALVLEKGREGEVYNIGAECELTNRQILETLLKKLDKPQSLIKPVPDRPGHDRRYALNSTKLRAELGWEPAYSFDTGMEETIAWYLENRDWWQRIKNRAYLEYYKTQYGSK